MFALVINEDGSSKLQRTPISKEDENQINTDIVINVLSNETDEPEHNLSLKFKGVPSSAFRYTFEDKTEKEIDEAINDMFNLDFKEFEIVDYKIENLDDIHQDLVISIKFKAKDIVENHSDILIVNYPDNSITPYNYIYDEDERQFPIFHKYKYKSISNITINYDGKKYSIKKPQPPFKIRNDDYKFSVDAIDEDGKFIINQEFVNMARLIEPECFKENKKLMNKVDELTVGKLVLQSK